MIQRIQTLFLIAVALVALLLFFIPFQVANDANLFSINLLSGFNNPNITSNIYVPLILAFGIIGLAVFTILKFKNRVLQYKLSNILMLLNIVVLAFFFLLNFYQGTASFSFGAFLPVFGIIFSFLAAHFIKKDEQLVRSADRIR